MDHLPPVNDPHNPISVRYLGGRYAGHGFTDFKIPDEISLEELQKEDVSSELAEAAGPVLQVWFYFGMLREVLGLPVVQEDFVVTRDGAEFVTTAKLKEHLAEWKKINDKAKEDTTGESLRLRNDKAIACLQTSYETWISIPRFAEIVGQDIQLSIHILASTLENALNCVSDIGVEFLPWRRERSAFLAERMLNDGWCPVLVEQVARRWSVPWHYYASLCPPSELHGVEHGCTAELPFCKIKLHYTNADFAPKHICESPPCMLVDASPPSEVSSLIERDAIPILQFDEVTGKLNVIEFQDHMQYTAMSHVWSDGLGNAEHNQLPICQLRRLQRAMSKLPWTNNAMVPVTESERNKVWQQDLKEVELSPNKEENDKRPLLFWIDTICVPLDGPLRQKAISSMRKIYDRANRVLVFDADLVRVKGSLCAEEVLSRISLSNWTRRFWTLQEAVLAKVLWFQFGDDSYRQLSIASKLDQKAIAAEGADLQALVKEYYFDNEVGWYSDDFNFGWRSFGAKWTYARRLALVWNELQYRTSSRKSDQPICIGTLMDMDVDKIQNIDEEIREQELWQFYEAVPAGVLFVVAPRLDIRPYRWAPASLYRLSGLPPPGIMSEGTCTEAGLMIAHHGIITTTKLEQKYTGVIPMKVGEMTFLIKQNVKQENTPWHGIDFTAFDRLAVLLAQYPIEQGGTVPYFERSLGALVGIKDHRSGESNLAGGEVVIECEYLRAVSVLLRGCVWEYRGQTWTPEHEKEKNLIVPAEFSAVQQQWLIS